MALFAKEPPKVQIVTIQIQIVIRYTVSRRLRLLEVKEQEQTATCTPTATEPTQAFGVNCEADSPGEPNGLEVSDEDPNIGGIPKSADPTKSNSKEDYSNPDTLAKIANLPKVNITEFNEENCADDGEFIITGEKDKDFAQTNYSSVLVTFSSPDSSALCDVQTEPKFEMKCHNKDKFSISQIIIEKQVIEDSEGNAIFMLEQAQSQNEFACEVSVNSVLPKNEIPENPEDDISEGVNRAVKSSSSGLSGGAIAAIIIGSIVALIGIGIVVWLIKSHAFSRAKPPYEESTLQNFKYNPNPPEITN
jgi:hypothetical protein